ncbi:MAG: CPBP family intramembrane glutamic endopeptidase [archaeon]
MAHIVGYMDILSHYQWGTFEPFSFMSISSTAQLGEIAKFGAIAGVFNLVVIQVILGLLMTRRVIKLGGLSMFMSPHTPFEALVKAPLLEETVYRLLGMIAVVAFTGSLGWAILLTSVAFGLGHLYQGPLAALASVVAGAVFAVTFLAGGLVAAVVAHSVVNLIVFLSY